MDLPLAIYHVLAPILAPGGRPGATAATGRARPPGQLIWLDVSQPGDMSVLCELVTRLSEACPDLWFLITDRVHNRPPQLAGQCFHQQLPHDSIAAARDFLDHWRPDIAVVLSGGLRPTLIAQAAENNIPLYLLDTGAGPSHGGAWRAIPGLARSTYSRFKDITSADQTSTDALIRAGAPAARIRSIGAFETGVAALPCDETEREILAAGLASRPVWLAAGVEASELDAVLGAHARAMQRAHRLLLVITARDQTAMARTAAAIHACGLNFAHRLTGAAPDAETQVLLADKADEMGLWFRLSPVTFMGRTMAQNAGAGFNPLDAAALGSAVLHGPATAPHQLAYQRLGDAGASRQVCNTDELAQAVEALLSPDKAAEMAHAGWKICSAGAEVMDQVLELLTGALRERAAAL